MAVQIVHTMLLVPDCMAQYALLSVRFILTLLRLFSHCSVSNIIGISMQCINITVQRVEQSQFLKIIEVKAI